MTASRLAAAVAVVMLLLLPIRAHAIDLGQWVSGLKAQVFVNERVEYQTNVFQTESDTQDDLIFRTAPGFLLTYDKGPVALSAGYRAEFLRFLTLDEQDNTHHFVTLRFGLNFGRFSVSHSQDIALTSDPPLTELTGRIDSTTVSLAPEFEYKLTPRLAVGVNYGFTRVKFQKSAEQISKTENVFGGSVLWKFVPKADVFFRYNYGFTDFDEVEGPTNPDRDIRVRHLFFFGLRGDITPKLSSSFRVGYEDRSFEDPRRDDPANWTLGGDTTFRPTERTRLSLSTQRSYQDSIFGTTGVTVLYISSALTATAEQQLGRKFRVNGRLSAIFNEYPQKDVSTRETIRFRWRDDEIYVWGGGIDYDIQKWLTIGGEYSHTRRESSFSENNYKDDKATVKLTLTF